MNSLRAKTVVVGRSKPKERWPLERARLINRHNENMKAQRAYAVREREYGRQEGRDDTLRQFADRADMMEYFFREAARELGRMTGSAMRETLDSYDPVFNEKKHIADQALSMARLTTRFSDIPTMDASQEIISSVEFPSYRFHVATRLPRY